jgi:GMP synthase-like glutamine amidotransferase
MARRFGFQLSCADVCRGDDLPESAEVHAVILGGTAHEIAEGRPWMLSLSGWLLAYRELRRPLLGICGGHQLVATLLSDAAVEHRRTGTLIGTYPIRLTEDGRHHPLFDGLPAAPRFHFSNYMHIIPARTASDVVLASHDESPAVALDHGAHWHSCQFHPESRKESWACRYRHRVPDVTTAYAEAHDGTHLIGNFLRIAQHDRGNQ